MRKGDGTVNLHPISAAYAPHGTGKITKAICGKKRCMFKRRNKIAARQMCLVVLYAMKGGFELCGIAVERRRERSRGFR